MALPDTFKALSDPTRREILNLLKAHSMPADEIAKHFRMTGATVSHHLSILKNAGLVCDCHEGKYIYYKLNLSVFEDVLNWLETFLNKSNETDKKQN